MTKSIEEGENEFTRTAKKEAARTGRDLKEILARMLKNAGSSREKQKIVKAQKYMTERNKRKRR